MFLYNRYLILFYSIVGMKEMDFIKEEDRMRRMQILEKKIRDPRSVSNVDSLLVRILNFNFT